MPTINVENLILNLQQKLSLNPSDSDIMNLSVALKQLDTSSVLSVTNLTELPVAGSSTLGLLYYVSSEENVFQTKYINNSYSWTPIAVPYKTSFWTAGWSGYGVTPSPGCCFMMQPGYASQYSGWCDITGVGDTGFHAIDSVGNAYFFGYDAYGYGGVGNCGPTYSTPQKLTQKFKKIARSQFHALGISPEGSLFSWGTNCYNSMLGYTGCSFVPRRIDYPGISDASWICVAAEFPAGTSAAIRDDGTLWVWGRNYYGSLGTGCSSTYSTSSPVTTCGGGTNWTQVTPIYYGYLALKSNGCLWGWGLNSYGNVGAGNTTQISSPTPVFGNDGNWCQVASNDAYPTCVSAAIKTDGTLWTWGYGCNGAPLGAGVLLASQTCPAQTSIGGTGWCQVTIASRNASAIKTDGTLWTWGCNDQGQLGLGCCPNTFACSLSPACVPGKSNWCKSHAGYYNTIALDIYQSCTI